MTDTPPCLTSLGCWRWPIGICGPKLVSPNDHDYLAAECARLRTEAADPGTTPAGWHEVAL